MIDERGRRGVSGLLTDYRLQLRSSYNENMYKFPSPTCITQYNSNESYLSFNAFLYLDVCSGRLSKNKDNVHGNWRYYPFASGSLVALITLIMIDPKGSRLSVRLEDKCGLISH